MSRKADITALLSKADRQLAAIVKEYSASLHKQSVDPALRVDIKNYCENLRSVLDYLANDIREKFCQSANPNARIAFPILPDATQFSAQSTQRFPGLKSASSAVWSLLEQSQPYQQGKAWLAHFNKVNNENKHGKLVPQKRRETTRIKADIVGGGSVSWNPANVKFSSGVYIGGVPVDPRTQMPFQDQRLTVTKTVWVDFVFDGVDISAISLLREALAGVKAISAALSSHLWT
jgi:hypothetical protein